MLKIALIQYDIVWQNSIANMKKLDKILNQLDNNIDLIVLPEMFNTGFSMNSVDIAEDAQGNTMQWLKTQSLGRAICGSLAIKEKDMYYNSFFWVENGELKHQYNKKYLFTYAQENENYSPGKERIVIEYKNWKIAPFVCYDLRFPEWLRCNTKKFNYNLGIVVASWPQARIAAWEKLLQARAIENVSYFVGVNRIGMDGNNVAYSGSSLICNYLGEVVAIVKNSEETITMELELESQLQFRKVFPVLEDANRN